MKKLGNTEILNEIKYLAVRQFIYRNDRCPTLLKRSASSTVYIAKHLHTCQICSVLPTTKQAYACAEQPYHVNINSVINSFINHVLKGRKF